MFKKVLVPIDLSSPGPAAISCQLAKDMIDTMGAEVHLVNVLPGYHMPLVASFFPQDAQKKLKETVHEDLKKIAAKHFDTEPGMSVVTGKRADEIILVANEWNADLIIVGCRAKKSRGGERLLGSCSSQVADRAKCNVLVAR